MKINYKELILDLEKDNNKEKEKENAQKVKKEPTEEYCVESVSGCDFVILRKTAKTQKRLVMLFSVGQYYIKNLQNDELTIMNNQKDFIEAFANFTSKLNVSLELIDPTTNELSWLHQIKPGKVFASHLSEIAYGERILSFVRKGIYNPIDLMRLHERNCYLSVIGEITADEAAQVISWLPNQNAKDIFIRRLSKMENWNNRNTPMQKKISLIFELLQDGFEKNVIYHKYGLDQLKKFVQAFLESSLYENSANSYTIKPTHFDFVRLLHEYSWYKETCNISFAYSSYDWERAIDFDFNSFVNYLFVSSVEQGYKFDLKMFIEIWRDTLELEVKIFGKIETKYPQNLLSYHQVLTCKWVELQTKLDKEKWDKAICEMSQYQDMIGDYVFITPKTQDDLTLEGQMQSNCVAYYGDQILYGTKIIFMRKKTTPQSSYITIEVTPSGTLGQVKRRFNQNPSLDDMAIVYQWFNKHFK